MSILLQAFRRHLAAGLLIIVLGIAFSAGCVTSDRRKGITIVRPEMVMTPGQNAAMADFWEGRARWQLVRSWTSAGTGWAPGFAYGSRIRIVNGVWYLFSRKIHPGESCHGVEKLGIEVRESRDNGLTWSEPVEIVAPTPNMPWSCMATDGDAVYDAKENRWHLLFQSLGEDRVWSGSHLVRDGADPRAPFVMNHDNPVIPANSLWSRICDRPQDDCTRLAAGTRVFDEGTFDIFFFDGEFYWVGFHGYDGKRGYRGIAKTRDFQEWIAGDPRLGLPDDAVLDADDALGWREEWNSETGPIGAGAGSILFEEGYYYMFAEFADLNLLCLPGQNWDWGLFRTSTLTSTRWEQYPQGNPIFYSGKTPGPDGKSLPCPLAYGQLFRQPATNEIYFKISRDSPDPVFSGIYLYKLVPSVNLLKNGDFWRIDALGWSVLRKGQRSLRVPRYPEKAADGGQYLELVCGRPGDGFYQEVDVSAFPLSRFRFGGWFSCNGGEEEAVLSLIQLDRRRQPLREDGIRLSLSLPYRLFWCFAPAAPGARFLRYRFQAVKSAAFRADLLFLEPVVENR